MLIEIHMIQNHSPSNLNRDDLGAPKTCVFGGVTRARISSQCLKRSIRNPGNAEDVHNRGKSPFAEAMGEHLGTRTRFFPWQVQEELNREEDGLKAWPTLADDAHLIVLAATRIAVSAEKEQKAARGGAADPRPKTAQLIHLGPGHANYYVQKLAELKATHEDQYKYHLSQAVGFQEMVRECLADSDLSDKERDRAAKASWVIAHCRMDDLLKPAEGEERQEEPEKEEDGQPGGAHAQLIAERLVQLRATDQKRFTALTKAPTKPEASQLKEDAPDKPKGMDDFMAALKEVNHCDAVDIALFGRMTTSDAFQNVEAAMQVAHAISTHAALTEVDYFTAVDDLGRAGGGAGHVNEAMLTSACFYKYFSLDWEQLVKNLAGPEPDATNDKKAHDTWVKEVRPNAERLAACALGHFLRAAACTTPTGKQNSCAAHNEPCGTLVEIKKTSKIPTNYANAFAEPVERIGRPDEDAPDEKSYEGRSVACLADHVQALRTAYCSDSTLLWYSPWVWKYPFRYWERSEDGKKLTAKPVTDRTYSVLDTEATDDEGKPRGLVQALIQEVTGRPWSEFKDVAKASSKEA